MIRLKLVVAAAFLLIAQTVAAEPVNGELEASPQYCVSLPIIYELNAISAEIKSRADLARHESERDRPSPLDALSKEGRREFLKSLKFNELGLASYRYDALERELTVSQAYLILALFGAQDEVAMLDGLEVETDLDREIKALGEVSAQCSGGGDLKGYMCSARATCAPAEKLVCRGTC